MSDIEDLIHHVKNGDNVSSEYIFNNIMSDKLSAALDSKKVEVASSIFSTSEPEAEVEQETEVDESDV